MKFFRQWTHIAISRLFQIRILIGLFGIATISHAKNQPIKSTPQLIECKAKFAFYAHNDSHLLVTLCKPAPNFSLLTNCHPWRYHIADKRWEEFALSPYEPDWSIENATYSPDGRTIAATMVNCLPSKDIYF